MDWRRLFPGKSESPDPRAAFGQSVVSALRDAGFREPITLELQSFQVRTGEGVCINLHNFFADLTNGGQPLDVVVASIVRMTGEAIESHPSINESKSDPVPVLHEKLYFDIAQGMPAFTQKKGRTVPYRSINAQLGAAIAINGEQSLTFLSSEDFLPSGHDFEETFAIAMENLRRWPFQDFHEEKPGVWVLEDFGGFASSTLLLPDFLQTQGLSGTPVVMVPGRNMLLMADMEDHEALNNMTQIASDVLAEPRPLSGFSYVFKDGNWHRFPGVGDKTIEALKNANTDWAVETYQNQADEIQTIQQRVLDEDDIKVMKLDWFAACPNRLLSAQSRHGAFTFCNWGRGAELLLPEADYVFFFGSEREDSALGAVAWHQVRNTFGHLMRPLGLNPERYFVSELPNPQDIERLKIDLDRIGEDSS